ncbi:putative sphingosine-1-phosphate lyase protein [Neofusicoccum parvum]|uniref:Sphingosine-1-phosphate lyase protein n=1 Tax=Neofusicoccum parvum TaxID=310453 RepID=A0ACB5SM11_9PEZI|nr:putative sphingosine-1-phosphate lyase protein [Neofusicoccum parvum]
MKPSAHRPPVTAATSASREGTDPNAPSQISSSPRSPALTNLVAAAKFLLHQWMIIGIGVVCALAYFFPHVAAHGGTIRSEYSILYGAVAVIFLISGLSIAGKKLLVHAGNWRLHLIVQGASFLLCPITMYAFVQAIVAGDPAGKIDRVVLVGFVLTACIPTTIASNVVMTRAADGDEAAALVEVLLGNVVGPVISPAWTVALLPKGESFEMWKDVSGDLSEMYKNVFKLLGLSVYLPLAVGQLVRWKWPEVTMRTMQRFKLNKVGTFCLLLLIWSSFSSCFETSALQTLSTETVILIVFFNIGMYLFWTIVCFLGARIPESWAHYTKGIIRRFDKPETIAICFCGPAKTAGLGIPLVYAMWVEFSTEVKAKLSIPLILYTTEQVFCAHFLVHAFKRWVRREKIRDDGVLVEQEREPEMAGVPSTAR